MTTNLLRWSILLAIAGCAGACGGTYVPGDDDDGSGGADDGGSATGGVSASGGTPGAGGNPSSGGSGGGGSGECCLAEFHCDPGDAEIDIDNGCPVGAECYAQVVCCTVGYCMKEQALCDGIPVCEADESEVSACPDGWSCTPRARCGSVITCVKDDICDPLVRPFRDYIGSSPDECQGIDYSCPEHTTSFEDECGCGCEQPTSCPKVLDCAPGGVLDPLCSSLECPYTLRAL